MTTASTTVRRLLLVVVAVVLAFTALVPSAQAQLSERPLDEDRPPLLDADLQVLRSGLLELRASLNTNTVLWLSLFNRDLVPLADALDALESDIDALLVTIDGPMTPDQYRLALVQLNDGVESWNVVAEELSPYWQTTAAEWEQAWAEVVLEWDQAWRATLTDWQQRWDDRTAEVEAEWTAAVSVWEHAWVDAVGDWETNWNEATTQWETDWNQAAEQWENAWEQAVSDWAGRRGN